MSETGRLDRPDGPERLLDNARFRLTRRPPTRRLSIPPPPRRRPALRPALLFVFGFAVLILVGTVLLSLPTASASGQRTPLLDALFTATSAVCVTGLVVLDTGTYWSQFGQVVLLVLIQIGGLGFMTTSTLLLLIAGRRLTLRNRVLLNEALGSGNLGSVAVLARRIVAFAVVAELVGSLALAACFASEAGLPRALWIGLFHSVSSFNNAGFDVVGQFRSLTPYSQDVAVLSLHAILIVLGGISFTAIHDLIHTRRFARLALDSKLVLLTTSSLLVGGAVGIALTEWRNPATLGSMEPAPALLNALFVSVASRTAGFNALNIGAMAAPAQFLLIGLMFIGGASGSTAGGIKVQTFSLLLFAILSALRGWDHVEAFRRRVPTADVLRAVAVGLLAMAVVFTGVFAFSLSDQFAFNRGLFEVVSAFGTVGMTTGITPETSPIGRGILILIMFTGRLGPLTLALALAVQQERARYNWPEETVKIG